MSLDALDVLARVGDALARREDRVIGRRGRGERGELHRLPVPAVGRRVVLRRLVGRAVLPPEIDLVARAERADEIGVGAVAPASGDRGARRARSADQRPGGLRPGDLVVGGDRGKQRGARLAGERVGLLDLTDRSGDVEVLDLGLLHEAGQLGRVEGAPPVGRVILQRGATRLGRGEAVGAGHVEPGIGHDRIRDAAAEREGEARHRDAGRSSGTRTHRRAHSCDTGAGAGRPKRGSGHRPHVIGSS